MEKNPAVKKKKKVSYVPLWNKFHDTQLSEKSKVQDKTHSILPLPEKGGKMRQCMFSKMEE